MHVHRSAHARNFTVLPNVVLQDRQLSYTARGLLVDLLSRPEGWREDGRQMADSSPQGRRAIYRALKELVRAGYYRVVKV
ncbi:MAG: helix-turn-helix domain-containing protein, partial [Streptomyces sp.]|nr:helix-turn-helix domain-containing protein [Streptomyces sp.]